MSEYQRMKARALEAQKEREREIQYELEAKAERQKAQRREEEERRKRQEAASREARTLELKRANEAINKGKLEMRKEEYDPFAEVERKATPMNNLKTKLQTTLPTRSKPNGSSFKDIPRPPLSIPKAKTTGTRKDTEKEKESSPPALGRKEKAARALMESTKRSGGTSIFSVRPSAAGPSRVSSTNRIPSSSTSSSNGASKGKNFSSSVGGGAGKGRMKGGNDGDLRALCPDRGQRDNRTIDQIQRDIKARKAIPTESSKRSRSPDKDKKGLAPIKTNIRPPPRPTSRRAPSPTPSTSSSTSEDIPRKKAKPNEKQKVSAMIQELFRRPDRPAPRPVYTDEESGSDMEAGLSDVEEEEQRALKVARREDELAEKEERERRARKEKLRKEREGR